MRAVLISGRLEILIGAEQSETIGDTLTAQPTRAEWIRAAIGITRFRVTDDRTASRESIRAGNPLLVGERVPYRHFGDAADSGRDKFDEINFANRLVEQQDLLLVGRLKNRCHLSK